MKTHTAGMALALAVLTANSAHASISGGEGNSPVENRGWPTGSEHVANVETRIANWEGPPFGGGQTTFEFREESTANFNKALELFAKLETPKKELILQSGPADSFWLGIRAKEDKKIDPRIDWSFVVWDPRVWKQLYNDPKNTFLSDHPNFRKPVESPKINLYLGGGTIAWEDVVVPEGVTVIDQRRKEGDGPAVTGKALDIDSGEPLAGVTITLQPGTQKVEGELPRTTTDAEGRFVLEGFPKGAYAVVASLEGYATKRSLAFSEILGSGQRSEEFKLSKAVGLHGVVRDPDGEPLKGARVIVRDVISSDGFGYRPPDHHEMHTDADGRFSFQDLPRGECHLTVWSDGYYYPKSVTTKFTLPGEEDIVIDMIGTGIVKGTLTRSRKGQLNVSIEAPEGNIVGSWGGGMFCKPDGSFLFENVPAGDYFIGPNSGPHLDRNDPAVKKITVKGGDIITVDLKD